MTGLGTEQILYVTVSTEGPLKSPCSSPPCFAHWQQGPGCHSFIQQIFLQHLQGELSCEWGKGPVVSKSPFLMEKLQGEGSVPLLPPHQLTLLCRCSAEWPGWHSCVTGFNRVQVAQRTQGPAEVWQGRRERESVRSPAGCGVPAARED